VPRIDGHITTVLVHKVGDGIRNKKEEESPQRVWDEMMSRQSTTDLFGTTLSSILAKMYQIMTDKNNKLM
jgi:hypothetical protein